MPTTATAEPRLMTFAADQGAVPPATRARDLLALAKCIAEATDPAQPVALTGLDRLAAAMALPNLPDDDIGHRLTGVVAELHEAELAGKVDPREADYVHPDDYLESAAQLARDAVAADVAAGAR